MGLYGTTKNAERVSVDLGLTRQVREQRGTIIPNQFNNPTRNPTSFQNSRCIRSFLNKENTSNDNSLQQIQQDKN